MNHSHRSETVLAVYPTTYGFGYVLMQSALSPTDWGTPRVRGSQKNRKCLEKISALIDSHQPDTLVLEDATAPGAGKSKRIQNLCKAIAHLADSQGVDVHVYPRSRVNGFFKSFGARTRHEIAIVIAKQISALERFLPSRRQRWQNEAPHLSIFNAAALAMTYFGSALD